MEKTFAKASFEKNPAAERRVLKSRFMKAAAAAGLALCVGIAGCRAEEKVEQVERAPRVQVKEKRPEKKKLSESEQKELDDKLIASAMHGQKENIEYLLREGANVNAKDSMGRSVFELSFAWKGKLEVSRLLLKNGADVNSALYVFLDVVEEDKAVTFRMFMDAGINPDLANYEGDTALIVAARKGNGNIASKLIDAGADVNIANKKGETALMLACETGRYTTVEQLLENGADIHKKSKRGQTALMFASLSGNTMAAEALLKRGADAKERDEEGNTPLILNAWGLNGKFSDAAELLIEHGVEVNARNKDGDAALMLFARQGNVRAVETLLRHGAEVNARNNRGETALMLFAIRSNVDAAEILLRNGAEVNAKDNFGNTALAMAADRMVGEMQLYRRKPPKRETLEWIMGSDIVKTLIEHGGRINPEKTGSAENELKRYILERL